MARRDGNRLLANEPFRDSNRLLYKLGQNSNILISAIIDYWQLLGSISDDLKIFWYLACSIWKELAWSGSYCSFGHWSRAA